MHEHGDPSRKGPYPHAGGGRRASRSSTYVRPLVHRVETIHEALALLAKGRVVELADTRSVNTLLTRLAAIAQDAAAKGMQAPTYDLCKVSVRGTNLFCTERVRTAQYPQGLPRIVMPQLKGIPRPGSDAAKLELDKSGQVNAGEAFLDYLGDLGISSEREKIKAAKLKASQAELVGSRVAALMTREGFNPRRKRIYISRDNYIVDGHHHWAAAVGLDAADNKLGDVKMKVVRIDAPITEILQLARSWTREFGVMPKAAVKVAA